MQLTVWSLLVVDVFVFWWVIERKIRCLKGGDVVKKLGLIINPIAGMGGSVGLKGTDNVLEEAIRRGAVPKSNQRAKQALNQLLSLKENITIYTAKGEMGEDLAKELGFKISLIEVDEKIKDNILTETIAKKINEENVNLLIFAGGDGTARDIYNAIGTNTICLGIPAGVKIHSPVYAKTPVSAGNLAQLYLEDKVKAVTEIEVVDIDEDMYRKGQVSTRLYGYLKIPLEKRFTQSQKTGSPVSQAASIESIAHEITGKMEEDTYYLIGAGTTPRGIMTMLGLEGTLIGVDLIKNKKIIAKDIYGKEILKHIQGKKTKLIVTITGGQGFLFGRGNQQIIPEVIREIGKENIIIIATKDKLSQLRGASLIVDTGDINLDKELEGYYRVTSAYRQAIACRVSTI